MIKSYLDRFAGCVACMLLGCSGGSGPAAATGGSSDTGGHPSAAGSGANAPVPSAGASSGGVASDGVPNGGAPVTNPAGGAQSVTCDAPITTPPGKPALTAGVWTNISPVDVPFGDAFTQGMAIDPCDPATLYLTVCSFDVEVNKAGLYKSTDAGATWKKTSALDEPIRIRIDPRNPRHLYAIDGVRGGTQGFFVSVNGGETFEQPEGFASLKTSAGIFQADTYDVAADPADFDHVLVSHHSAWGWTDTKWNTSSGVLESKDGGTSWIVHEPLAGWGSGHAINFLFNPELGLGNSDTWLLGTQGPGMFRTEDAGKTWTKVSELGIQHGGGSVYYDKAGVLYASGANGNLRSADNGLTWTKVSEGKGYNAVFGDGELLYTAPGFGPTSYFTSPEGEGTTWTPFNTTQQFSAGPFEMALDRANGILYSANWGEGLWALKLAP
jgi:photosystem II stability/assembly factor-like uncharacterized protein